MTSLHLVDPRFFHLDMCFAPLALGHVMYFPEAFDAGSLKKIEAAYPAEKRIAVTELEATQFACNVINVGEHIIMDKVETNLAERLRGLGYDVAEVSLSEFQQSGGSAKTLALRLSDNSVAERKGMGIRA